MLQNGTWNLAVLYPVSTRFRHAFSVLDNLVTHDTVSARFLVHMDC